MGVYYVELNSGYCGLIEARTLRAAEREALRENGTANLKRVTAATVDQVKWVAAMGGWVPSSGRKMLDQQ